MRWLVDLCGILGTVGFGWACAPTAYRTLRARRSIGTPIDLSWNILLACFFMYAYVLMRNRFDWLVFSAGFVEVVAYSIVIYYHYFPYSPPSPHSLSVSEPSAVKQILDPKPFSNVEARYRNFDDTPGVCGH